MHKEELITFLVKRNQRAPCGRTKRFYREALDDILDGIQHQLSQGKEVSFLGFGTFYTRVHKGRTNSSQF
jgi:nucleoid DNA-binding protein